MTDVRDLISKELRVLAAKLSVEFCSATDNADVIWVAEALYEFMDEGKIMFPDKHNVGLLR